MLVQDSCKRALYSFMRTRSAMATDGGGGAASEWRKRGGCGLRGQQGEGEEEDVTGGRDPARYGYVPQSSGGGESRRIRLTATAVRSRLDCARADLRPKGLPVHNQPRRLRESPTCADNRCEGRRAFSRRLCASITLRCTYALARVPALTRCSPWSR